MVATVGSVQAIFQADMRQFVAGLQRGEKQTKRTTGIIGNDISRMASGISRTVSGVGVAAFAGLSTAALASLGSILSVAGALNGAKNALNEFDKIAKQAKAAGLDAEAFQEFAHAAELGGVATDEFAAAMATFAKNAGMAVQGKGRMVAALKALHPELLKNIRTATSQDQRLRAVADALDKETDASRKAAIASAAFGDAGVRMVEMLKGGSAALDATSRQARQLGIIIDRDLLARAETLNDEFSTATKVLDLQFKQALVNLAPIMVGIAERAANLASDIRTLIDSMKDLEDRSSQTLGGNARDNDRERLRIENEILALKEQQRQVTGFTAEAERRLIGGQIVELEERLAALTSKGATIETILQTRRAPVEPLPTGADIPDLPDASRDRAAAAAIREAEAVKELIARLQEELALVGASEEQKRAANILREAGAAATAEERAQIVALNEELHRSQEAHRQAGEAAEFFRATAYDAFTSLLPVIESGNAALDNLINSLVRAVAQAALLGSGPLAGLFGGVGGAGGGGILGSLFGAVLHQGGDAASARTFRPVPVASLPRFHSGRSGVGHNELLAVLENTESVLTARQTSRIVDALGASSSMMQDAGPIRFEFGIASDGHLNLMPEVRAVSQEEAAKSSARVAQSVPGIAAGSMDETRSRKIRPRSS